MTTNIAVSVSQASGDKFKANRNMKFPLILSPLNGTLPTNSGVLDASVAERMGVQAGGQYVLAITFRGYYEAPDGTKYPNYNYALVTKLGAGFENMVAQQVVASMNFGFGGGTPTPAPTPRVVVEHHTDDHVQTEEVDNGGEQQQTPPVPEINAELQGEGKKK